MVVVAFRLGSLRTAIALPKSPARLALWTGLFSSRSPRTRAGCGPVKGLAPARSRRLKAAGRALHDSHRNRLETFATDGLAGCNVAHMSRNVKSVRRPHLHSICSHQPE